ncbi:MAG: tRNA lysidine(34) synthetase TilS [Candidatus Eisenbacteria bacterium]
MLLKSMQATIDKYAMLKRGDRVVVALSGGPDSVALLCALNLLKGSYGIDLHVAHLEHGIRGDESLEDMRFVEDLCRDLSLTVTTHREDVPQLSRSHKLSVEAVARKVRYAFFERVLEETGFNKIATGHNANDSAETVLLNIIRGSAMSGLAGIRPAVEEKVVRPLIETTRDEIVAYLEENGINYRLDSSNLDERYERNKVRRTLMPLLEREFNPKMVDSLARTASVFSMLDEYFRAKAGEALETCCKSEDGRTGIDLDAFMRLPRAVRLFTLYSILRSLEGDRQVVSFDNLNALLEFAADSRSGSRIDVGSGIVALREYDRLVIGLGLGTGEDFEVTLELPGKVLAGPSGITLTAEVLSEKPSNGDVSKNGSTVYFDLAGLKPPLVATNWRQGDRLVPFGLSGSKKIHDIFIDAKVPASRRGKIPIVRDSEGIIWIAGVRRANRARITEDTRTVVKITHREEG